MNTFLNVVLVILIILAVALALLYYFGRKLEKRQVENQAMLEAAAQTVSILVIDKKNQSCYLTPMGELVVGIQTNDIRVEEEENLIKINVEYSLDINYEHVSDCNITVAVRPRSQGLEL